MDPFHETAEQKFIRSLQFVKVQVDNSGPNRHGYLTDLSVAMILVELRRNGLTITNGDRNCG
jgi:hypothetical protein